MANHNISLCIALYDEKETEKQKCLIPPDEFFVES